MNNKNNQDIKFTFSLPNGDKFTEEVSKFIMTNIIENNRKN